MSRPSESGSVLIFILIGVALFAALSFAVMGSLRTSSSGASGAANEERMSLALTELRNTVLQTRTAIQLMVANGYSPGGIDVSASGPDGNYYSWTNNVCGGDDKCKLYHPDGGGLNFFLFSKAYPQFSALPNVVASAQIPQGLFWTWWAYRGTFKGDIIYRVRITKEFCNFVNKKNGITADIDSFQASVVGTQYQLADEFAPQVTSHFYSFAGEGENSSYLFGKNEGCYLKGASPNQYIYVALVYAR